MFRRSTLAASAALLLSLSSSPSLAASKQEYIEYTLNALDVLNQRWYSHDDGTWQKMWWNSGAMLATIGDVAFLSDGFKKTAVDIYSTSITAAKTSNGNTWLNDYYDDEGWWAMGWIKAYDVTKDTKYLDAAVEIFEDLLKGDDATCGGHWWSKPKNANTAIGNELYLAVAASIANRMDDGTRFQNHAQSQADWFLNADFINENGTISDSLNITTCERQGAVYSYNQGVILGALVEMNKLTGNSTYLDIAGNIAHHAIRHLARPHDGILTDVGYPGAPDTTGAQFKGIFARNLMYLHEVRSDDRYVEFLQANADSIWSKNNQGDGNLGVFWQGPLQNISAASQSSALDCLVAAATVSS